MLGFSFDFYPTTDNAFKEISKFVEEMDDVRHNGITGSKYSFVWSISCPNDDMTLGEQKRWAKSQFVRKFKPMLDRGAIGTITVEPYFCPETNPSFEYTEFL